MSRVRRLLSLPARFSHVTLTDVLSPRQGADCGPHQAQTRGQWGRQPRLRDRSLGRRRPPARQHRILRVQARRPRPDLPQVRLRRLRGGDTLQLLKEAKEDAGVDPEDPDEYTAKSVFWLPPKARWGFLRDNARSPEIGKHIDEAMKAIEDKNPPLKGILPRDYARPALDKPRLGQLIDRLSNLGLGGSEHKSKDTLGRVYEYFLGRFASGEGRRRRRLLHAAACVVEFSSPCWSRSRTRASSIPAAARAVCSSRARTSSPRTVAGSGSAAIFGQELNHTTWRLCKMNLAIRGIEGNIREGDSFTNDLHPDLRADFVLANPPFNMSDWSGQTLREDVRWKGYEAPSVGNANYAWILHFIHHLAPNGYAGFVMANGSMSSNTSSEGAIRRAMIENDLVDCLVALPGQLFYTTQIPVCLWFLAKNKGGGKFRDRRGQTLFIDARKMGTLIDRVHRDLTDADIARIARTYHAWRGEKEAGKYADEAGFCKSTATEEIKEHGYVLTPGRYVGAAEEEDDGEPFEEKMTRLTATLHEQFAESARLEEAIRANLEGLGYAP